MSGVVDSLGGALGSIGDSLGDIDLGDFSVGGGSAGGGVNSNILGSNQTSPTRLQGGIAGSLLASDLTAGSGGGTGQGGGQVEEENDIIKVARAFGAGDSESGLVGKLASLLSDASQLNTDNPTPLANSFPNFTQALNKGS